MAALMAILPNPPLTQDQVKLMKGDNVVRAAALTLAELGIASASVEDILPTYVNPDSKAIR
jgi:NADH dehydrogenase